MSDTKRFDEAQIGDLAFTYEGGVTDFSWVTDLEYFDERWGEIKLTRKCWRLVAVDEIVLPDPHPEWNEPADSAPGQDVAS